jgi:integrase
MLKPQNATPLNSRNTRAFLDRVAEHLYRNRLTGGYYGMMKVAGKRKTKALTVAEGLPATTDRGTAKRLLAEWEQSVARLNPEAGDLTLDALIRKFEGTRSGKAAHTVATEASIIRRFRSDFGRDPEGKRLFAMEAKVARVRPSDVEQFLANIAKDGVRHSTYNRYRLFLRQLFRIAVNDGVIAKNPLIADEVKPKKKQKVFRNIPTADEFERILAEIRNPAWEQVKGKRGGQRPMKFPDSADFAEFLGRAGLGQAEARGLKWENVDFQNGILQIVRKKTGEYFEVPIYATLRPLLERRKAQAEANGGADPEARVFNVDDVRKALSHACTRLKLTHFSERNLRAMRIRELFEGGVDVKTISLWQGHRDGGKLIMEIYTEIFRSDDAAYRAAQIAKADAIPSGKIVPFTAAAA